MIVDVFLDTNILVYAVDNSPAEAHKHRRALELIDQCNFGLSAQVLQEFYVTVTRKIAAPLTPLVALEWIEQLTAFPVAASDTALVKIAIETGVRYQISYWDAAIISAAQVLGAKTLFSEDLNHQQYYGSVQVINPFLALRKRV